MRRTYYAAAVSVALGLWMSTAMPASGSPTLQPVPSKSIIEIGEEFTVTISIGSTQEVVNDLYGIGLRMSYNPLAFEITDAMRGDFLTDPALLAFERVDNASGFMAFSQVKTQRPGVTGQGALMFVTMRTVKKAVAGLYAIILERVSSIDGASNGVPLEIGSASVRVAESGVRAESTTWGRVKSLYGTGT